MNGSINLHDSNVLSEDVFKEILNIIYGLKLQNANLIKQNIKAIDLIDCSSKTIIQVSSDNSKAKVQSSLDKIELPKYDGYTFKFVCISKGVSHLKKYHFNVPKGISFNAEMDCYDDKRIVRDVLDKDIDTISALASYLEKSILPATANALREACSVCGSRNYTITLGQNRRVERLEIKKFCKYCNKQTLHRETK